jgi:RNA polymerase sigma-70 factor (ECF subfamily)
MWALSERLQSAESDFDESDSVLVRLAQSSPMAFEPLYVRYRERVLAYCYRRLGDRDDAEDAASAVFVAVLRGLNGFRDRGRDDSFRAWLFCIAHNEIAMRHRSRSRHQERPLIDADEITDRGRSPEEHAVFADGQRRLAALLSGLPPREREVIELRMANLLTGEIARALGINEQSVRSAQARAVAKLRVRMGAASVSEPGEFDA